MSSDARHQAIIGASDGIPIFKDKNSRSGWPFVIRNANLPEGLWMDEQHTHMVAYVASDYLTWDCDLKRSIITHK
jgi:hypothetical protein